MIKIYSIYEDSNAFIIIGNHFTENEILNMLIVNDNFKISDISYGWGTSNNIDFIIQEKQPSNFENKVTFINFFNN